MGCLSVLRTGLGNTDLESSVQFGCHLHGYNSSRRPVFMAQPKVRANDWLTDV